MAVVPVMTIFELTKETTWSKAIYTAKVSMKHQKPLLMQDQVVLA